MDPTSHASRGKSPITIQPKEPAIIPNNAGAGQVAGQGNNYRNENILCAVLALLKELDESGLELVKRDIERKLTTKKQGM